MPSQIEPARSFSRQVGRAVADYAMIRPDDRLLMGVSGGKGSLSRLHVLLRLRAKAPVPFELGVATVDPCIARVRSLRAQRLRAAPWYPVFLPAPGYRRARAVHHAWQVILRILLAHAPRRALRHRARAALQRRGALAQHLDDLASFLMSALHNGRLRTMKAHYTHDAGDLRIIRPLIYVRERQTVEFARRASLPVTADNCPACFRMPTQRHVIKQLLAQQEQGHKRLFANLLATIRPFMGGERQN